MMHCRPQDGRLHLASLARLATPRMDATSPSLPGHAPLCSDDLGRHRLCHGDVARVQTTSHLGKAAQALRSGKGMVACGGANGFETIVSSITHVFIISNA
jgi:hypothetical protein